MTHIQSICTVLDFYRLYRYLVLPVGLYSLLQQGNKRVYFDAMLAMRNAFVPLIAVHRVVRTISTEQF
jgi:hypothetical protein